MEEIYNETPEDFPLEIPVEKAKPAKQTWKQWFGDRRRDSLGLFDFWFIRDHFIDGFASVFDERDLLRRLGRLLSHSLERFALGKL